MTPEQIESAYRHSIRNRREIEGSRICGCFQCLAVFYPHEITEWTDEHEDGSERSGQQTAWCPRCGVDSVIGDGSGYVPSATLLEALRLRYFEG